MSFAALLTDTISVLKQNGERVDGIKSSVQSSKIFLEGSDILIEPLDLVHRKLSNGSEETFEVIDPGFHEAFHGMPAGYQMKVRKLGVPEARKAVQHITYNFHGHNARVNQNSTDMSINTVSNDITAHIQMLRDAVKNTGISDVEKQEAQEIIDTISEHTSGREIKKSVVGALLKALPQTANIASIGSLILDAIKG